MAKLLTVGDARVFLRGSSTVTGGDLDNAELLEGYLRAVDVVIEDIVGPVVSAPQTFVCSGGGAAILLPVKVSAVTSIVENGVTLSPTDYTVDGSAGIIYRGAQQAVGSWQAGNGNVTVVATTGADEIPGNITLAAKELLRHLWVSRQGPRPAMGGRMNDDTAYLQTTWTPSGFAVPHKVAELLAATPRMPGFA